MRNFGDSFCLTLITNDASLASKADKAGVNRIGADLESIGKAERQVGLNTRISAHTWEDLANVLRELTRADLFVRINPPHRGTPSEVETAIELGAKVIMLPFFKSADEVDTFIRLVRNRAYTVLLLETAAAVTRIRDIVSIAGADEIMIGLNDLRLQLGIENHFEVLTSPLVDMLAGEVRRAGFTLAIGGVAKADDPRLPLDPDLIFAQYPRLGATGALLTRAFFDNVSEGWNFAEEIRRLRQRLTDWSKATPEDWERARDKLAQSARRLGNLTVPRKATIKGNTEQGETTASRRGVPENR